MNRLKLADILVTVVIAVIFALVYRIWGPLYNVVALAGIQLEQLTYGMWFIAATVAFLLIRKPGIALLAEMAAASGELIAGSQYGLDAFLYGVVQGLACEMVFALFRYKRFDLAVAVLSGLAAAAGSLLFDVYKSYFTELQTWAVVLYVAFRFIGAALITGVFAYYLVKALEKTGVTHLLRPVSKDDYSALDR
ncbi:ECF transporter S component [Paenibacillus sp. y28]|uniref:ECF transporter S component n=1 Tax=Paenibacillus sp. y28 TaxID=3129110 RepID=UPI003019F03B